MVDNYFCISFFKDWYNFCNFIFFRKYASVNLSCFNNIENNPSYPELRFDFKPSMICIIGSFVTD